MESARSVPIVRFASLLLAIEVRVGGSQGTWLLDTGAGITCVDEATARREGIEGWGRLVGHRMSGERVELARAQDVELVIGGQAFRHGTVGIADLGSFVPPELGTLAGAVSLTTFEDRPITLDVPGAQLVFETPESLVARMAAGDELSLRLARPVGGLSLDVFVEIESRRGPLFFELDSGCTGPVILAPHAAEALGLPDARPGATGETRLPVQGTKSIGTTWVVNDIIHDGILGLSVLDHGALTLDLARGRAWLARG